MTPELVYRQQLENYLLKLRAVVCSIDEELVHELGPTKIKLLKAEQKAYANIFSSLETLLYSEIPKEINYALILESHMASPKRALA
jgi:hypothetical protein